MGPVSRFLATLLVVLAILLTTLYFAARTEGGRSFLQEALEKRLGEGVALANARIGLPYDLVLGGIASQDYDGGGSGFRCEEARIGLGFGRMRMTLVRPELNLRRTSDGAWGPDPFGGVGDLPWKTVGEVSELSGDLRKHTVLRIRGGSISWLDERGIALASVGGVSLDVVPVRFPGRRMYHYRLSADSVLGVDGVRINGLEREWLSSDDKAYLELSRNDPEGQFPLRGFWENEE
jgi:hypothetical protein